MKQTMETVTEEITEEEAHCVKCGGYLTELRHGSYAIVPCSRCGQRNIVDYTGTDPVVKRYRKHP